ncbi:DUF4232 domain-containing protein [Streptomyces sp. BR1]|uniref:DUF4232 domain-containing protein n=1 Tax=Streptomyces sp. BR1 TaxID=1592323 RepID=UPI00402B4837
MQSKSGRHAVMVAAVAVVAGVLVVGCDPSGNGGGTGSGNGASTVPSAKNMPDPTAPSAKTPASTGSGTPSKHTAAHCTIKDVKVTPAHQAAKRPSGTGTGAAVVGVVNTSAHPCSVKGYVTVAGAGNGAPGKNVPLTVHHTGTASTVVLAPGAQAWTKLTFVQVQGEGDGYCKSGSTPYSYPTMVIGVPGAGAHQTAMDDGVFAECDNTVTVTALSSTKPA